MGIRFLEHPVGLLLFITCAEPLEQCSSSSGWVSFSCWVQEAFRETLRNKDGFLHWSLIRMTYTYCCSRSAFILATNLLCLMLLEWQYIEARSGAANQVKNQVKNSVTYWLVAMPIMTLLPDWVNPSFLIFDICSSGVGANTPAS